VRAEVRSQYRSSVQPECKHPNIHGSDNRRVRHKLRDARTLSSLTDEDTCVDVTKSVEFIINILLLFMSRWDNHTCLPQDPDTEYGQT
jgi:hypothetical protein